jgi:hypothetical protein
MIFRYGFEEALKTKQVRQVKDMDPGKKRVGVAENPRSGVGARGSRVKKDFS